MRRSALPVAVATVLALIALAGCSREKIDWKSVEARRFPVSDEWLDTRLKSLPFTLTNAQHNALKDIRADLDSGKPTPVKIAAKIEQPIASAVPDWAAGLESLLKGRKVGDMTYKVHLDGYDLGRALKGEGEWPRKEFLYWTDDGDVCGLRYSNWKLVFMEQRSHGFDVWQDPLVTLRLPKLFSLRSDPFERAAHESMGYGRWRIDRIFLLAPAMGYVGEWIKSMEEFPPRQKPGSFNLSQVMEKIQATGSN